jgi:hypothetical protein
MKLQRHFSRNRWCRGGSVGNRQRSRWTDGSGAPAHAALATRRRALLMRRSGRQPTISAVQLLVLWLAAGSGVLLQAVAEQGSLGPASQQPLPPPTPDHGPPDLHMVHEWEKEYAPWRPRPGAPNSTQSLRAWGGSTPRPKRRGLPRDEWQALPVDQREPRFRQCMAQQAKELSEHVLKYGRARGCTCMWLSWGR